MQNTTNSKSTEYSYSCWFLCLVFVVRWTTGIIEGEMHVSSLKEVLLFLAFRKRWTYVIWSFSTSFPDNGPKWNWNHLLLKSSMSLNLFIRMIIIAWEFGANSDTDGRMEEANWIFFVAIKKLGSITIESSSIFGWLSVGIKAI